MDDNVIANIHLALTDKVLQVWQRRKLRRRFGLLRQSYTSLSLIIISS
jgi:hypothetical protein